MALPTLDLTITQSNDATFLTLTDATGETASTGWGVGGNEDYTSIVDTDTTGLQLTFTAIVRDKNDVTIEYLPIDLLSNTGLSAFSTLDQLTWTLYASDFVTSDDSAMGVDTDRLTDGIWDIAYTVADVVEGPPDVVTDYDSYTADLLVDGDVRADTFDALREITKQYDDNINDQINDIMQALLKYAYLGCINASGSVSEQDNLIHMLWTLDKLNSDGSKYDW
jgi:hypothetical protein